jgi:hypothetical protein
MLQQRSKTTVRGASAKRRTAEPHGDPRGFAYGRTTVTEDAADVSANARDGSPRPRASRIISGNERVDEVPPVGQVILPARYPVRGVPEEPHGARVRGIDQERPVARLLRRETQSTVELFQVPEGLVQPSHGVSAYAFEEVGVGVHALTLPLPNLLISPVASPLGVVWRPTSLGSLLLVIAPARSRLRGPLRQVAPGRERAEVPLRRLDHDDRVRVPPPPFPSTNSGTRQRGCVPLGTTKLGLREREGSPFGGPRGVPPEGAVRHIVHWGASPPARSCYNRYATANSVISD